MTVLILRCKNDALLKGACVAGLDRVA